ncbi:hypothetical protein [Senegalia massiliensis]|uniref:Uncharacterized protein n=1 Tax=Senegalia massiliensis TaxID=1720316 RepID=A0A845R6W5_9CLOT|nr:hypothetical protein [Senegalia massiliensis]NBI08223.1 hypothetical protein [Senegalia massiliensis]
MNKFQKWTIKEIKLEEFIKEHIKKQPKRNISYRKARIEAREKLRKLIKNSSDDELEYFGLKRKR